MTTSGQPAPGKRITLPSGAVWEGGSGSGTATITLPDEDPITLDSDGRIPPNALIGSGLFGVLDSVLSDVLGTQPGAIAERVAGQAMDLLRPGGDDAETKTRLIKFSSKTTLLNPAKAESGVDDVVEVPAGYAGGGTVRGPGTGTSDSILARLSNGEFVVNAAATSNALPLLEAINAGWVPSAGYLAGMLPGFADGGVVGSSPMGDPNRWRDLLGTGLIADVLGGVGGAAIDAAGAVGAALGGALAPVFGGSGPLTRRTNDPVKVDLGQQYSPGLNDAPPLSAELNVQPQGVMNIAPAFAEPSTAAATGSVAPLASLSEALTAGIMSSATEAGGQVGLALGRAIAPALGPAGELAPDIGKSLGESIGSRFGGGFAASMSLKTQIDPMPTEMPLDGGAGGVVAPGGASPATVTIPSGDGGSTGGGNSIVVSGNGSNGVTVLGGTGGTTASGASTTPRTPSLSEGLRGTSLAEPVHKSTFGGADYIDRGSIVGGELASNFGKSLGLSDTAALRDAGSTVGALVGALGIPSVSEALAAEGELAKQLGINPEDEFILPFEQQKAFDFSEGDSLTAGISGFLSGSSSGGLVKGVTGAAKSLAQDAAGQVGSFLGAGLGTAIAGPAGAAIGSVLGSLAGSVVAGKAVDLVAKPVEWMASTAKELVGTGFGLTDLADGPGGHTARGDIYNFNGMDPKSVAISIARVQRRLTFVQQRGGGIGR
ncbi:hypothetical protein [Nocardia coubleae]|uniref:Uncharacterized protein n=1 Tax=Nocardia coubleae TaxID=356147 RepID=A0A846W3N8_9NOCA|nr:hypothetical protein [Nocardia coubleae]NKX87493.1 hypothetical protein [Nocardia coubleae]